MGETGVSILFVLFIFFIFPILALEFLVASVRWVIIVDISYSATLLLVAAYESRLDESYVL